MTNNKYIIKSLAPWMIDELLAFSKNNTFDIIFLREQEIFYKDAIEKLKSRNIKIYVRPYSNKDFFKKIVTVLLFLSSHLFKFKFNYNGVIGLKSIRWFLLLDTSIFSKSSNIHAQFATQAALISLLIKEYVNGDPKFSFTFHAHDIYFKNSWFSLLVNKSHKSFSISDYNIKYVNKHYLFSDKIALARLGVFRKNIKKKELTNKSNPSIFTLGLMSRFVEKKGISYLMKAMLRLENEGYHFIKLILAGDGPLNDEIQDFIEINNLSETIKCLGRVKGDEKENFYNSIDAFILPSISIKNDQDGIPVVLMEAVAYGLPLISTNVSGIPEICINEYNGFLIEEKSVEAIFESIIKLNENTLKRKKFSENSILMSDNYDIQLNSKKKLLELEWE